MFLSRFHYIFLRNTTKKFLATFGGLSRFMQLGIVYPYVFIIFILIDLGEGGILVLQATEKGWCCSIINLSPMISVMLFKPAVAAARTGRWNLLRRQKRLLKVFILKKKAKIKGHSKILFLHQTFYQIKLNIIKIPNVYLHD